LTQEIIIGILGSIGTSLVLGLLYLFRKRIKKWWYSRKIKPIYNSMMDTFEKKVLPDYVETRPKLEVQLEKSDIPEKPPFGYICVPAENLEAATKILLTFIPVNSSLRIIRMLFNEKLKKALFDYLSYKLAVEYERQEIAVEFRDKALREYPEEYKIIEKLDRDEKLTSVVLAEAFLRIRKTHGNPSSSDMEEFSLLVKKIAEMDVAIIRIGDLSAQLYVDRILQMKKPVVLLARGENVNNAKKVSNKLTEIGYKLIPEKELGLQNPETGTWQFKHPPPDHEKPFIRIWHRPPKEK